MGRDKVKEQFIIQINKLKLVSGKMIKESVGQNLQRNNKIY